MLLFVILWLWQLGMTTDIGKGDFLSYWSALHLITNGENPYSPDLMLELQRTQIGTTWDYPIMTWNPPSLFALLLPLGWLSFPLAKSVWLIANFAIVLTGITILSRIYLPTNNFKLVIAFLIFSMVFPHTLLGLLMGQIVSLVFLGLVLSLHWARQERWFLVGVALFLTSIKPQLVILALIYLLARFTKERRLQVWQGLIATGLLSAVILFFLRPEWIVDYLAIQALAPATWATPTIGGLLSFFQITENARYLILLLLPLPMFVAFYSSKLPLETTVAGLTLITIPLTFFGWSYDQIMLLLPIAQMFAWLALLKNGKLNTLFTSLTVLFLSVNYYQRLQNGNEVFYVWIPIFWALLYGLVNVVVSRSPLLQQTASSEKTQLQPGI
jgi:hypothetical protein